MRISTVATFVLAISVAIVTAIPMKKEENTEVDRSGPALSDVAAMADQAIDVRKRLGCSRYTQSCGPSSHCCYGLVCTSGHCDRKPCHPKDGECVTSLDCCGLLVCWTRAQSWEGGRCGERP